MNSHLTLEQYRQVAGQESIDKLEQLALPLNKIRIVHVSSTSLGGGVAEILQKFVPLTQAVGIDTHWEVILGPNEFFQCTKEMHNSLQGKKVLLSPSQLALYEEVNRQNAERLKDVLENADIVFVHDPQPLPLIKFTPFRKGRWIFRCHIDASKPFRMTWKYLRPFISQYDASIFSLPEFTHPLEHPMFIIAPSIDPLSEKNRDLDPKEIENVLHLFNIDPSRPKILQVSRFDRFKDPVGVIEAYRMVKKINSEIQLILVGSEAQDDPESEIVLKEVKRSAQDDPDIHILLLPGDSHRTVNALQRASDIILQKSIREGFGLTVAEALWKSKPVIGGNAGGIKIQLINGQTGFIVNTPEGAAFRIRTLLQHPRAASDIGARGKEYVREKFLLPRQLYEYLTVIHSLLFKNDRIELTSWDPSKS